MCRTHRPAPEPGTAGVVGVVPGNIWDVIALEALATSVGRSRGASCRVRRRRHPAVGVGRIGIVTPSENHPVDTSRPHGSRPGSLDLLGVSALVGASVDSGSATDRPRPAPSGRRPASTCPHGHADKELLERLSSWSGRPRSTWRGSNWILQRSTRSHRRSTLPASPTGGSPALSTHPG